MWLENLSKEDLQYKVDCEVEGISFLPDIFASTRERVDVAIYKQILTISYLLLACEVQSSPMIETVRKATYFAANIIRLLKFQNSTCNEFTVFALLSAICIVKINVHWNKLVFHVTLTCYDNIQRGVEHIKEVMEIQLKNKPPPLPAAITFRFPYPIKLG